MSAGAVWAASAFRPGSEGLVPPIVLEQVIPSQFGNWVEVKSPLIQMGLTPQGALDNAVAATYDAAVMRSYVDAGGSPVMVAFAYGRSQRQEGKIHRPELCYSSQGFKVDALSSASLQTELVRGGKIAIKRLVANTQGRLELVSYWIRIGDIFSKNAVESRFYILGAGLQGRVPDGILFRVSQIVPKESTPADMERAYARQEKLMLDMVAAMPPTTRWVLVGSS